MIGRSSRGIGCRAGLVGGVALLVALSVRPGVASAQPGTVAPAPPGAGPPPPPPPPGAAPVNPSARYREGLYVSVGIGGGMANVIHELEGREQGRERAGLFAFGFTVGGHWRGLGLGGTVMMQAVGDMDSAGEPDKGMAMLIGPSLEWFPSRTGGFFTGAMIGFGPGDVPFTPEETTATSGGLGLWAGYTMWVGDQWSLGAKLQVSVGTATTTDLDTILGTEDERSMRFATWALTGIAVYD